MTIRNKNSLWPAAYAPVDASTEKYVAPDHSMNVPQINIIYRFMCPAPQHSHRILFSSVSSAIIDIFYFSVSFSWRIHTAAADVHRRESHVTHLMNSLLSRNPNGKIKYNKWCADELFAPISTSSFKLIKCFTQKTKTKELTERLIPKSGCTTFQRHSTWPKWVNRRRARALPKYELCVVFVFTVYRSSLNTTTFTYPIELHRSSTNDSHFCASIGVGVAVVVAVRSFSRYHVLNSGPSIKCQ